MNIIVSIHSISIVNEGFKQNYSTVQYLFFCANTLHASLQYVLTDDTGSTSHCYNTRWWTHRFGQV